MRFVPCLLAFASLSLAAEAVPFPGPAPKPGGQPQSIPIQMPPAPKTLSTIRLVAVDANGPTAEGQKVLDDLLADGWRSVGISTVTPNPAGGATVALLATKPAPKEASKP